MRFLSLYRPGRDDDAPPREEDMVALGALIEEMTRRGVLVATEGLRSSAHGARVRVDADGMFEVDEGPFPASRDVVAGYAILEAPSLDEAVELAKRFLAVMGGGETEVRLMYDGQAPDRQVPHTRSEMVAR